jgi:hypothetical protein
LQSNTAACYLKLRDWKAAVDAATASIGCLDRCIAVSTRAAGTESGDVQATSKSEKASVVELSGENEAAQQEELQKLLQDDKQRDDLKRIRAKALLRRARARTELASWANLQGAEEDYKQLAAMDNLPPQDKKIVHRALRELPSRIHSAKETEMAEMMGKLKDVCYKKKLLILVTRITNLHKLGNGILKPFGLSTDNFKFIKDEKTGGYSMQFQSGK